MAPQYKTPHLNEKVALYTQAVEADTLADALRLFDAGRALAAGMDTPDLTGLAAIKIIHAKFAGRTTR